MKLRLLLLSASIGLLSLSASAQDYMTRTGHVSFVSTTPMESIEGNNYQVTSALNTKTGELLFSMLQKSFEFKQALMQEHYNEKYVESDKFPKATFKGKIRDFSKVNFSKDGTYKVDVEGDLTMHGATRKVTVPGSIEVKGPDINAKATFDVKPEDYKIEIPGMVREKIARIIPIKVDMNYKPKK